MRKHVRNRNIVYSILGVALLLNGCTQKVSYSDPQAVETTTVEFGATDLQKIALEMTDSMLSSKSVAMLTNGKRPVVLVESVKNKTAEHIDTESITDSISTRLLNSGEFRFVDMTRVEMVRQQLNFQNNDMLVNPETAIQFGKMVGAQYMLYGNLSSISKQNAGTQDVYYKMTMRLMDLETGLLEWADETEIRKQQAKSMIGW